MGLSGMEKLHMFLGTNNRQIIDKVLDNKIHSNHDQIALSPFDTCMEC